MMVYSLPRATSFRNIMPIFFDGRTVKKDRDIPCSSCIRYKKVKLEIQYEKTHSP